MTTPAEEPNDRTTGPTPLPPAVRAALAQPMPGHRSEAFRRLYGRVSDGVQAILGTRRQPMFFSCSGTGGLEAAVSNCLSREDRVLSLVNGFYGDLFSSIAGRWLGQPPAVLAAEPGQAIDPDRLRRCLARNRFDAVLITHGESSTGVLNPVAQLAACLRQHSDALVLVDAISSAGTVPIDMDERGLDVVVTASQKALMAPPGLAIVVASQRTLLRRPGGAGPHYFDFRRSLDAGKNQQTPSTPCLPAFVGLDVALQLIAREGQEMVHRRHAALALLCRAGVEEAGLDLFAAPGFRAPGITAVRVPAGLTAPEMQAALERDHRLLSTPAVGSWHDRVLRIGHMGWVSRADVSAAVVSLHRYLRERQAHREGAAAR